MGKQKGIVVLESEFLSLNGFYLAVTSWADPLRSAQIYADLRPLADLHVNANYFAPSNNPNGDFLTYQITGQQC